MVENYTLSFFGAETELVAASKIEMVREPFMNIVGLQGNDGDSKNITDGCFGDAKRGIPKDTDLFKVQSFAFGLGDCPHYKKDLIADRVNPDAIADVLVFNPDVPMPTDIEELSKDNEGTLPTNNFTVMKFVDSHSTGLAKALMTGKRFKAAQIFLLQQAVKDSAEDGFVANRFVFKDVYLTNIEYSLDPVNGDPTHDRNIPTGYSVQNGSIMGGHMHEASEILTFYAQHTWVYTHYYNSEGIITSMVKGR